MFSIDVIRLNPSSRFAYVGKLLLNAISKIHFMDHDAVSDFQFGAAIFSIQNVDHHRAQGLCGNSQIRHVPDFAHDAIFGSGARMFVAVAEHGAAHTRILHRVCPVIQILQMAHLGIEERGTEGSHRELATLTMTVWRADLNDGGFGCDHRVQQHQIGDP